MSHNRYNNGSGDADHVKLVCLCPDVVSRSSRRADPRVSSLCGISSSARRLEVVHSKQITRRRREKRPGRAEPGRWTGPGRRGGVCLGRVRRHRPRSARAVGRSSSCLVETIKKAPNSMHITEHNNSPTKARRTPSSDDNS